MEIMFRNQSANIGDHVKILWDKKTYEGKSVRRRVIDSIMEKWRMNTLTNLNTEFDRRYRFSSTAKSLKMLQKIYTNKLSCEPTIWKRHQEAKDWFKTIISCIDNMEDAIVIGVEACEGLCSDIMPSNVNYIQGPNRFYFKYKILIHGYVPRSSTTGPQSNLDSQDKSLHKAGCDHVQFWVELLDNAFEVAA